MRDWPACRRIGRACAARHCESGPAMRDRSALQLKRLHLCGSLLSKLSDEAGPFCIAVEEAALCCSPLGGSPQGRLTACGLRIKATLDTTTW
jgi:hypothetical protein